MVRQREREIGDAVEIGIANLYTGTGDKAMANKNDSLGERMKAYEQCYVRNLTGRSPIIIRVDDKN